MRYEILGPLRITKKGGNRCSLTPRKQVILLTALLIRANQVVSTGQLLTELWGDTPPRRASASLHVYISQVRKALQEEEGEDSAIITRPPGYVLRARTDEIDVSEFNEALDQGRQHLNAQAYEEAVIALRFGLSLWRGPVLGGLTGGGPIIRSFTAWLEECRLECVELLAEALLARGEYQAGIRLLYSIIHDHPLRETFYRLLMITLYRANRQADALLIYQQARDVTISELGLEPSQALRDLHQAILVGDHLTAH